MLAIMQEIRTDLHASMCGDDMCGVQNDLRNGG
jgi:hypothetical protein